MSPEQLTVQEDSAVEISSTQSIANGADDGLAQFRSALTADDFNRIDRDKSNSLNIEELNLAASLDFSPEKQNMIKALTKHLESQQGGETPAVISPWFAVESKDGDKQLDLSQDDPLAEKQGDSRKEKDAPTEEELKERLDKFAQDVTHLFRHSVRPLDNHHAWSHLAGNHYIRLQHMWDTAKALPGDPMVTMENALNKGLEKTGHHVKFHKPTEPDTPGYIWMKSIDAYMTVDPSTRGSARQEKMGAGIIGLRGRAKD